MEPSGILGLCVGSPNARPIAGFWFADWWEAELEGNGNHGKRQSAGSVGILAVQGDFEKHAKMLERIGAPWRLVKHASEFEDLSGLIIPGGESTTMLKFFEAEGLGPAIKDFAARGGAVFGTCAGAIVLAKEVLNPPQGRLGLLDISIERNAYGRQIDSSVRRGECPELTDHPVEMVFIRAPIIRSMGRGVRVLGRAEGIPVLVEQVNVMAATFHPELTEDETIHRYFLSKIKDPKHG